MKVNNLGSDNMIEKICANCEHGVPLASFYEGLDGKLYPCESYIMYCGELDDHVRKDDKCNLWESGIKTVKVTYK